MGGNTTGLNTSTGTRTNPDEDALGDACDTDDDNDGLPDATEALMTIRPWSGYSGTETTVCAGPGVGTAPIRVMSPVKGDVDFDYVLDGRECQFRSRPDASCRTAAADAACVGTPPEALNCGVAPPGGPANAPGCAQPGSATVGCVTTGDPDGDTLYMPGACAGSHLGTEQFFRTRSISQNVGPQINDIDGDGLAGDADADSDGDTIGTALGFVGIRDGWEVRFYGSDPSQADSDGDGCLDGDEITDLNGDGVQNPGDNGLRAAATGSHDAAPANGRIDPTRYALGTVRDLNKDGVNNSADAGILAAAIAAPGACPAEGGQLPTNFTKNLP
jgi:hypothetical protein